MAEGSAYHSAMQFEPAQADELLAPLAIEEALSEIAIFGPKKADVDSIIRGALAAGTQRHDEAVVDELAVTAALPPSFADATTVAAKLLALRKYSNEHIRQPEVRKGSAGGVSDVTAAMGSVKLSANPPTNQEGHEKLLRATLDTKGFPVEAQKVLDHVMLLRAKEKYLFDSGVNRVVVSDDFWLRDVWAWIAGKTVSELSPSPSLF